MIDRKEVARIIREKKRLLDDIEREWDITTKHMGCGELKEYKQFCIDTEIIVACLEECLKPKVGQWIPVEERLPEDNGNVLCWAESLARGGDVCFVGSCHNGFWFLPTACDTLSYPNSSQYEVVAWQPLPEPYQPKQPSEWKERMMEHFTKGE